MKYIAVQGCQLQFSSPIPGTVGDEAITTPPSMKVTAGGKNCYCGTLTVNATFTPPAGMDTPPTLPLAFSIQPTSQKNKIGGQFAVLEGDESAPVPWVFSNSQSGATASGTISVKIQSAGQQKVQGN